MDGAGARVERVSVSVVQLGSAHRVWTGGRREGTRGVARGLEFVVDLSAARLDAVGLSFAFDWGRGDGFVFVVEDGG